MAIFNSYVSLPEGMYTFLYVAFIQVKPGPQRRFFPRFLFSRFASQRDLKTAMPGKSGKIAVFFNGKRMGNIGIRIIPYE